MNDDFHHPESGPIEAIGPDPRIERALRALDPGSEDPRYWLRFHGTVMSAARDELARRRMTADVTVSELVTSWGRALVPAAVLAAAVASFLMLQPGGPTGSSDPGMPLALEEMIEGMESEFFAAGNANSAMGVTFAAEGF